jgi:crotonobetainyl-CoA:carnitine CoA-transferase CaiB-like acyl-CoA transferase
MALLPEGILAQTTDRRNAGARRQSRLVVRAARRLSLRGRGPWISIVVADETEWRALAGVVDPASPTHPRFADAPARKRNESVLDEKIAAWCASRTPRTRPAFCQAAGVAAVRSP